MWQNSHFNLAKCMSRARTPSTSSSHHHHAFAFILYKTPLMILSDVFAASFACLKIRFQAKRICVSSLPGLYIYICRCFGKYTYTKGYGISQLFEIHLIASFAYFQLALRTSERRRKWVSECVSLFSINPRDVWRAIYLVHNSFSLSAVFAWLLRKCVSCLFDE